jgi:outer membrane protein assembly factor BamB
MTRAVRMVVPIVALMVLLTACDWLQSGFDASNDGNNPTETAVHAASYAGLTKAWEYDVTGPSAPVLATADGRVIGISSGPMVALDAAAGTLDWSLVPDPNGPPLTTDNPCGGGGVLANAGPVVALGAIYGVGVACVTGLGPASYGLFSATVDPSSGSPTWTESSIDNWPDTQDVSRTAANGVLYTTASSSRPGNPMPPYFVYQVDLTSGSNSYFTATGRSIGRPAINATQAFLTTPGVLNAVSVTTPGAPLWTAALTSTDTPTPSIDGAHVYVTDGATVKAFDLATGALEWTAPLPATGSDDAPAIGGGRVFVRTANKIVAIDATTGAVDWTGTLGTLGTTAAGLGSPSVAGDIVYVGSQDGNLLAFDATGSRGCSGTPVVCTPMSTSSIGGPPGASRPVPASGAVYIGALHADGNMAVYRFTPH